MSGTPITIVGRVGQADLKFVPSGKAVFNASVAVKREKYNRDTKQFEEVGTDWHRLALWDKKAEAAADVVKVGSLVIVVGELESRDFEKDGQKRTAWEIRAQEIGVIPAMQRGGGSGGSSFASSGAAPDDPWATGASNGAADSAPF